VEVEFSDIRLDVGATATIYSQYLESGFIQIDKSIREHCKIVTALMHGIITDTSNFIRATPADFHAAAFLSRFTDADLLTQILSQARSKQTMEMIQRALGNRHIAESVSIAGIGYLRADNRDAIPQAADFLLTEENVHTAIVYGIVSGDGWDESLMGSMRTTKITINPDEFIKEVFGKDANGNYFGGGKTSAGAFNIPIGFLSGAGGQEYMELKWKVYTDKIKQKILAKISNE
jgi:nanoRNase/pAp phosphatase (c-di-AMP/oligoRNAs hydrolase)